MISSVMNNKQPQACLFVLAYFFLLHFISTASYWKFSALLQYTDWPLGEGVWSCVLYWWHRKQGFVVVNAKDIFLSTRNVHGKFATFAYNLSKRMCGDFDDV